MDLARTIRSISAGLPQLDPGTEARVRTWLMESPPHGAFTAALTPQQRRVLRLVAAGLTDGQIAERLSLEESDVGRQVAAVVRRLGARTRALAGGGAAGGGGTGAHTTGADRAATETTPTR